MPDVPAPRSPDRYRVALVCLGNICRSPMADVVLGAKVAEAGIADAVEVVSAGTGDWHVGAAMDRRAAALLSTEGYDATRHRAQQVAASWLTEYDLVLAMDTQNLTDLRALGEADPSRVRLFGDFDPLHPGSEVPDPYFGGDDGFVSVLAQVERTAEQLVRRIATVLDR